MLFSSLLTILVAGSAVFAESISRESRAARACRDELEAIVYTPQICAYDYLKKITRTLDAQSPLLWTDQATSVLEQFRRTYGVQAALIDAFGNVLYYPPTIYTGPQPQVAVTSVVRAWALGEGFSDNDGSRLPIATPQYVYASNIWNVNGEMYTLVVAMSKAEAPIYC